MSRIREEVTESKFSHCTYLFPEAPISIRSKMDWSWHTMHGTVDSGSASKT